MDRPLNSPYSGNLFPPEPRVELDELGALRPGRIWAQMKTEDLSFWLLCFYLFLEYVRPQTLYPALDVFPFTQIVILSTVFVLLLNKRDPFVSSFQNGLLVAFFIVILLSSAAALDPAVAFATLPEFMAWMLVYFIIVNIVTTEKRMLIFLLLFFLFNFKMAQFAFRGWAGIGFGFGLDGTGGGPGWFKNSGEFGIEMCVFFALTAYFFLAWRQSWPTWKQLLFLAAPALALCGLVSSASRGAVLGGAAVLFWMLLKSRQRIPGLLVLGATALVFYSLIPPEQMARFETAGEDRTSVTRIERWEKGLQMAETFPVLGVGYGNWAVADRDLFDGTGDLSHNLFIQCLSELGYSGLIVFLGMVGGTFLVNHRTRRLVAEKDDRGRFIMAMAHGLDAALVGYLVSGFFVTVLFYPFFWINLAMTVALNNIARQGTAAEAR